jgi:hypothetical protein
MSVNMSTLLIMRDFIRQIDRQASVRKWKASVRRRLLTQSRKDAKEEKEKAEF